jgi:hypothetical protein
MNIYKRRILTLVLKGLIMFLLRVFISNAQDFSEVTMSFTINTRYHYLLLHLAVRLCLYRQLRLHAQGSASLRTQATAAALHDALTLQCR